MKSAQDIRYTNLIGTVINSFLVDRCVGGCASVFVVVVVVVGIFFILLLFNILIFAKHTEIVSNELAKLIHIYPYV